MRISEIYTSIQGEGPGAGSPTTFIRFAGCNLKCAGWPCDTQHAIDPKRYRHEWQVMMPEEIQAAVPMYPLAVTLTGGEPLIQPAEEMERLVDALWQRGCKIELFTNGTQPLPTWVRRLDGVSVIMDWKLSSSGEDPHNDTRYDNVSLLREMDAIKFVCTSIDDVKQALRFADNIREIIDDDFPPQFYLGVAWGRLKESELAEYMVAAEVPLTWKLNVQVHNYIWPRDERRR